jgi:hypothetical protein
LLLARADRLDWARLLRRFRGHEAVLLAHLILFRYIYPTEADRVPRQVFDDLFALARQPAAPGEKLCRGTLFSYQQYLVDIDGGNYVDARLKPRGPLTAEQIEHWTKAPK